MDDGLFLHQLKMCVPYEDYFYSQAYLDCCYLSLLDTDGNSIYYVSLGSGDMPA